MLIISTFLRSRVEVLGLVFIKLVTNKSTVWASDLICSAKTQHFGRNFSVDRINAVLHRVTQTTLVKNLPLFISCIFSTYHKIGISLSQHVNINVVCSEIAPAHAAIMLQNYYT